MKRGATAFLKVTIFILGMIVLAFSTLRLREVAKDAAEMNPTFA